MPQLMIHTPTHDIAAQPETDAALYTAWAAWKQTRATTETTKRWQAVLACAGQQGGETVLDVTDADDLLSQQQPSPLEWRAIEHAIARHTGMATSLEGEDSGCPFIAIPLPAGRVAWFGATNDTWMADVYQDQQAVEDRRAPAFVADTGVPTYFKGIRRAANLDPERIAVALAKALAADLAVAPAAPATNVYEYYQGKFGVAPDRTDGGEPIDGLKEFPIDSHCGVVSRDIIDKAGELLALCDPHRDVVDPIRAAVLAAVEIVCFG